MLWVGLGYTLFNPTKYGLGLGLGWIGFWCGLVLGLSPKSWIGSGSIGFLCILPNPNPARNPLV